MICFKKQSGENLFWSLEEHQKEFPIKDKPSIREIVEVEMDKFDLYFVEKYVEGIPNAPQLECVSWYGDDAKFITSFLCRFHSMSMCVNNAEYFKEVLESTIEEYNAE